MPGKHAPWPDRFWAKVKRGAPDECWEWQAYTNKTGCGRLRADGRQELAPRLSWRLHKGPIPDGLCVLHTCDNEGCVNPNHLFLGTQADNVQDCVRKGREAHGERNGLAKLTTAAVLDMRQRYAAGGVTHRGLADEFGVHQATITRALNGQSWERALEEAVG